MRSTAAIPDTLRLDTSAVAPPPPDPYARVRGWIDPPEGFTSLALVTLLLLITVWTVEGAGWVRDMPPLEPVALAGVALAYLLAKIRVPAVLLHPVAAVVGIIIVVADTATVTEGATVTERLRDLTVRMAQWWQIASTGGISSDPVPFVFQVVVLTWVVAYASSWFVFRSQQIWLGVVPSGIALMVNLTYLPGRFTGQFVAFVIVAMLLAARLNLVQRLARWRGEGAEYSRWQELGFVSNAFWVALITLAFAFVTPSLEAAGPVADLWERYGGPWREFEREFDRLFASVSSGKAVPLHQFGRQLPFRGAVSFGSSLELGGGIRFGRDTVMTVQSDVPSYWRGAAYDTYTKEGWVSSARLNPPAPKELQREPSEPYQGRKQVTITVEVQTPTDVLFSAGIPLTTEFDAVNDLIAPATYVLSFSEPNRIRGLPLDLRAVVPDLPARLRALDRLPSQDDVQRLLPPDLTVRSMERRGAQVDQITVTRLEPFPPDSLGLRAHQRLNRGQTYTVTSWVSEAAEEDLKQAGTDYPGWVLDRYLRLPPEVPTRVRDLAREWTQGKDNPYDMALAIEQRLRSDEFTYSLDITQPPQGRDGVEHFLFYLKKGYCDYYASAMAVLLRAVGVPARVAVGYVSGDYDADTGTYTVREPHAHTWPEVYFPKYGWVEFNPTPSWPSLARSSVTVTDSGFDPGGLPEDLLNPEEELFNELGGGSSGASLPQTTDWGAILTPIAYALAALALVVFTGRTVWLWGLAGLNPAAQTYEKVSRLATLAGNRPQPFETPAEFAARLGGIVPMVAAPIAFIAASYARHRFSPRPVSPEEAQEIDANWRAARKELLLKALRWKRRERKQGNARELRRPG